MRHRIRAVFFDYDGTLIDSIPEIHRGVCRVLVASGREPVTFSDFLLTFKAPWMEWYRARGVTLSSDEITDVYFGEMQSDDSPYFPGVRTVIEKLRGRSIQVGVVSAHYEDRVRARVIAKDALFSELEPVVGLAHRKADAIRKLCETHGLLPEETLYVGDLASDVRDGREAGVLTAAFVGPHGLRASFADHEPHYYLESSLHEIFGFMEPHESDTNG